MTALATQTASKRRLLLASDRSDQSSELVSILRTVGEVDTILTSQIPDAPEVGFSGIVVDINLRSPGSVQQVRNKLRGEAYRSLPRLFVLADALHHGSMQAWALGATDTISRPFDPEGILQRIRSAFPDTVLPEMLDVVLHHHELLDGTGYPNGLRGDQISDIVRLTTIVDIHSALVENRTYRLPYTHAN